MQKHCFLILTAVVLTILSACTNPFKTKAKCPCRVKLVQLQSDGNYKTEVVEIKTLENPENMSSSVIRITVNPRFYQNGLVEELTPRVQFVTNSDGVIVPTTTQSSELFSIYKSMEDLYFFDQSLGIDKLLKYPRIVSLKMKNGSRSSVDGNNAFYMPGYDRIVILKYVGHKLPLAINQGVIAHEHFHAVFENIVHFTKHTLDFAGLGKTLHVDELGSLDAGTVVVDADEKSADIENPIAGYNFLFLMALNEGLADFWAYTNTNQTNPYLASYTEKEMGLRAVNPFVYTAPPQKDLVKIFDYKKLKNDHEALKNSVYGIGVTYSNLFRSLAEELGLNSKKEVSDWIIKGLKNLEKKVEDMGVNKEMTSVDVLDSFLGSADKNLKTTKICEITATFLSQSEQIPLCK